MKIRVSIIEDDAPLRAIFVEWLRQAEGIEFVREYPDAESALARIADDRLDEILSDINLPGLNGIECVRRLKPRLLQTQFVMLTVYEDTDKILDALASGASGYLYKEISTQLGIAEPTVNSFIRRIYEKLHVHSRTQAVAKYLGRRTPPLPRA